MAVLLQHGTERIMVVLVYRPPGVIGDFVNTLIVELRLLPTSSYITLVIGDFNVDQRLSGTEDTFKPLIEEFRFTQRSKLCMEGTWILYLITIAMQKVRSGSQQHSPITLFYSLTFKT